LEYPPERQIVGERNGLTWKPVSTIDCKSDLEKIVRLVKTVRNNLFHGGKHGSDYWDDPERNIRLLSSSMAILDQLAVLAAIEADYKRYY
jgi:hypothetical protein